MTRAVLFDLFETLVSELGGHRHEPTMAAQLGVDEEAFRALWRSQGRARNTGALPDYRAALREAARALGVEPDEAAIEAIYAQRVAEHAAILTHVEPMVLEMLATLRERGAPFGLVSNCDPTEVTAWAASPLAPYFPAPVFSWQVGQAKPDREIYSLALARLGAAPAETLFVGDGGSNELAGAARAGLTPYRAMWFLDRWPAPLRPTPQPYPALHAPAEVLALLQ